GLVTGPTPRRTEVMVAVVTNARTSCTHRESPDPCSSRSANGIYATHGTTNPACEAKEALAVGRVCGPSQGLGTFAVSLGGAALWRSHPAGGRRAGGGG
ncbi:MAG: hypothetical protein O3B24_09445, partial [Verrucomicrobia bacterium]|nr:hypothetical protein [Verrucomicrobiota bacterium]